MENWKTVRDFEDCYEVSDMGRVRRVGSGVLNPFSRAGYLAVSLKDRGRRTTRAVHTMVLDAFVGPRPEGLQGAHLNGDKADNCAENLQWATQIENEGHKRAHGTLATGEKAHRAKLTNAQAEVIREIAALGVRQSRIALLAGVSDDCVSKIVRHQTFA